VSSGLTCQELADFLMAFMDGELEPDTHADFEAHLALCPPCLNYLDGYRETVRLGRSLCEGPDAPVPDDCPERLVKAILAARRP
jgi:anti-sigma factor (TIGR02949 family)